MNNKYFKSQSSGQRSRWRFPNDRRSEKAANLIRFLLAEPGGFHQGAFVGKIGILQKCHEQRRRYIIAKKQEAREDLYKLSI